MICEEKFKKTFFKWNSLKNENKKRKGRGGDSLVRVTNALNITITYKFKIR